MVVASAGPYASLHLTPDRYPHQHPTTLLFFYRPDALPATQPTASKHWRHVKWHDSLRCDSCSVSVLVFRRELLVQEVRFC